MMQPNTLSIFIPMYNEKENITAMLDHAEAVIPDLGLDDYELLIVDDGSQDGSAEVVKQRMVTNPHIKLIQHEHNQGYGTALCTGFHAASREAIFYTDCDLPVDLNDLKVALPLLDQADVVIGYRIKRHETLLRALYSRLFNLLMRILFNVRVRDVNFSFKLVRQQVLQKISLSARTGFIDGQLLAEIAAHKFRMIQIPIEYTPRQYGRSNFNNISVAWRILLEMLKYWRQKKLSWKPQNNLIGINHPAKQP